MSTTPSTSPQPPAGGPPAAPPASSGIGKVILWIVGIFAGLFVLVIVAVAAIGFFVVHKAKEAGFDPDLMKKNPVLAVAKMSVAANPDQEMVSSDDSTGTIVVHDKKTGQTLTMKVDPDSKTMTVTDEKGKTVTMKLDPNKNRLVVTDDTGKTATITADAQAGNVEVKGPDGTFKMGANADRAPSWVPVYPGVTPQNNFSASANGEQTGNYSFATKDAVDKVLAYYESSLKSSGFKTSTTTNNTNGKLTGLVSGTADNDKRTVVVMAGGEDDGTKVNVSFNSKP
jgi:hypothetical protein